MCVIHNHDYCVRVFSVQRTIRKGEQEADLRRAKEELALRLQQEKERSTGKRHPIRLPHAVEDSCSVQSDCRMQWKIAAASNQTVACSGR